MNSLYYTDFKHYILKFINTYKGLSIFNHSPTTNLSGSTTALSEQSATSNNNAVPSQGNSNISTNEFMLTAREHYSYTLLTAISYELDRQMSLIRLALRRDLYLKTNELLTKRQTHKNHKSTIAALSMLSDKGVFKPSLEDKNEIANKQLHTAFGLKEEQTVERNGRIFTFSSNVNLEAIANIIKIVKNDFGFDAIKNGSNKIYIAQADSLAMALSPDSSVNKKRTPSSP